jgi:hypothetical protein
MQKIGESSTFPIAIGKKNSNHQCVEKLFSDEMTELRSGNFKCYNKHTGSFVHVHMELVASLQDQPERHSCNALMLGSGNYSSRWGFTGDLATVAHHIPSCVACVQRNKQFVPSNNHFQQCTIWETFGHYHLLWTPILKNYPSEFTTEEELYLSPKKLPYDMLKVGVMSSHANYVNGQWGIDTVN